ncbi:MAG: radical SAM protein, partial [Candidatus Woesearchaeota archaeon]
MLKENKYYSYNQGQLPKGCQYCVKGEKLVLFVTGICPRQCKFCPVSDNKYQKDVQFANERKVEDVNDLIKEAELMDAKGAGITGGDPLTKLDRTCEYILKLKEKFGKEFHIHLYTSLNLVFLDVLKRLFNAGLDEIRFHLDLDDKKLWDKLSLAKKYSWHVGVEVPLIIGREMMLKEMIDFIVGKYDNIVKVDFLNLNELEIADNEHYSQPGEVKDDLSYAITGSVELGLKLLDYVKEKGYELNIHLCTAKLKDAIQLSERIKRESEGMKKKFDLVDEEGMLLRGALYLEELMPGFSYRERL